MSRRYSNNNRNFPKPEKKFVPKSQSQNPNPNTTLSTSLRNSLSNQSPSSSASTVRTGNTGGNREKSVSSGNFVNYLPQDEAVASGLGAEEGGLDTVESQRVVDLLNRELSRLLKLSARDFWREVASDDSLHEFLGSFLKFRSRWYDFPYRGAQGVIKGVIVGEFELSRRVFMLLYRLSSNRDPGARAADTLSSKDHTALLQEKKLLDLPKLLDICAIYGHENEELTGLLVRNAVQAQPNFLDNLTDVTSHFLGISRTMHQRCMSSLEVLFSSGSHNDHGSTPPLKDLLEVMDFINDAVVSMDAFVTAYKPAAVFFSCPLEMSDGSEELLITLAKLHDVLLPSLHRGFGIILRGGDEGMISQVAVSLKLSSIRLAALGWKLLNFCFLDDAAFEGSLPLPAVTKMFPANVEDPAIRADILIQTFREINNVLLYAQANQMWTPFLQNIDRSYHINSKIQDLQSNGWILMDEEQLQYLHGITMSSLGSPAKESLTTTPAHGSKVLMDENAAILESKVSQIKDLFPDYGKGFLAACLEVYNQDPEEVIQRILEGTLHEDLQCLDTSLETKPTSRSSSTVSTKDKGKGKLAESEPSNVTSCWSSDQAVVGKHQFENTVSSSSSSLSSVGRFVRKTNDMSHCYAVGSRNADDVAKTASLISQYEYEDEYDDSFDDLGLSVTDSVLEESEMLSDRMNSKLGISSGTDREDASHSASDGKWGSRRKPQFYVKDGKNYSYKVAGAVAVANSAEASLVSQVQGELIYGLGRGGNIPLGAVKKLNEYHEQANDQNGESEVASQGNMGNYRGRGRRGVQKWRESHQEQDSKPDESEVGGRGNGGNLRGRGRSGRGSHHHRRDRAMNKHFAGVLSPSDRPIPSASRLARINHALDIHSD